MVIRVNQDKCVGCGNCMFSCPQDAIEIVDRKAHIGEGCDLCRVCWDVCGTDAIEIEAP